MKGAESIESYLIQMEAQYEAVGDDLWVVKGSGPDMVLSIAGSILVLRIKVMEVEKVPLKRREEMYKTLLEYNVHEMLHGSYGLEGGAVVATAALQLENLDYNELQGTMDDIGMAVSNHYPTLSKMAA